MWIAFWHTLYVGERYWKVKKKMETETQEGYICIPKEIFIDGEYNLLTAEAKLITLCIKRNYYEVYKSWIYESKGEFKNKKSVMHLGEFFIYREF